MPRRDGTGPLGGLGNCAKAAASFVVGAIAGIFMGFARRNRFGQKDNNQGSNVGQGQGRGFGQRFGQD